MSLPMNIHILGIAQDSGFPQLGCNCENCQLARIDPRQVCYPSSIAISLPQTKQTYLLDATPALPQQLHLLQHQTQSSSILPSATLLTHAHIGHYPGLMYLGKEAYNAKNHPVYCTSAMADFLTKHAPWRDLVHNKNIELHIVTINEDFSLDATLTGKAIEIPHRNEYADTVGFIIGNNHKKVFYLPDIDTWEGFETTLNQILSEVNLAFIDGTFYSRDELSLKRGRTLKNVPHPPISDTLGLFARDILKRGKAQIEFIHFNHTNPIFHPDQELKTLLRHNNFGFAQEGQLYKL